MTKFQLDRTSVDIIIGKETKEVTVYGFKPCKYYAVMEALSNANLNVSEWGCASFPVPRYDFVDYNKALAESYPGFTVDHGRRYKSILTGLLIENIRRKRNGEKLIPLLFCVELEAKDKNFSVDVKNVALSHRPRFFQDVNSFIETSFTDKELRRCYKMYAEGNSEVKAIMDETFKFVRVKQDCQNINYYYLELLPPFWQHPNWQDHWTSRKTTVLTQDYPKQFTWRNAVHTALFKPHDLSSLMTTTEEYDAHDELQEKNNRITP